VFVSRRHNGWHAEDDLDVIPVHFDPSDHHSDDVACPMPIERIQSLVNFVGEILQTANNQCQILFGFGGFNQRLPVFLQTRKPLPHARNAGLELCPIDQSFRIAVDQSADTAAQTADLALKCRQGIDLARTSAGRAEAAPVLVGKPSRIFKHDPDLVPDHQFETVAAHGMVITNRLPRKPMAVPPRAPIVAVLFHHLAASHRDGHLAVQGVSTTPADHQALEQPAGMVPPFASSPAVLVELPLGGLEHRGINQGRHRDVDPLLAGNRLTVGCPGRRL
jgi:hypothetical protein